MTVVSGYDGCVGCVDISHRMGLKIGSVSSFYCDYWIRLVCSGDGKPRECDSGGFESTI